MYGNKHQNNSTTPYSTQACLLPVPVSPDGYQEKERGIRASTVPTRTSHVIVIKRARLGSKILECVDMADPIEYDMATWRMYYRIINHRMLSRHKKGVDSSEDKIIVDSCDYSLRLPYARIAHGNHVTPSRICIQEELDERISEIEEDEGIFQLDL